jgi:hypothetical protein
MLLQALLTLSVPALAQIAAARWASRKTHLSTGQQRMRQQHRQEQQTLTMQPHQPR